MNINVLTVKAYSHICGTKVGTSAQKRRQWCSQNIFISNSHAPPVVIVVVHIVVGVEIQQLRTNHQKAWRKKYFPLQSVNSILPRKIILEIARNHCTWSVCC